MDRPWRKHPHLAGRPTDADYPDDFEILAHDGSKQVSGRMPEVYWALVCSVRGDVFTARLADQAKTHLTTVKPGDVVFFVATPGLDWPVMVTPRYVFEKRNWIIHPCPRCGCPELLNAPSELIHFHWPSLPAGQIPQQFTTNCPRCGDVRVVSAKTCPNPTPRPNEVAREFQVNPLPDLDTNRFKMRSDGSRAFLAACCAGCGMRFDSWYCKEFTDWTDGLNTGKPFEYSLCNVCQAKKDAGQLKVAPKPDAGPPAAAPVAVAGQPAGTTKPDGGQPQVALRPDASQPAVASAANAGQPKPDAGTGADLSIPVLAARFRGMPKPAEEKGARMWDSGNMFCDAICGCLDEAVARQRPLPEILKTVQQTAFSVEVLAYTQDKVDDRVKILRAMYLTALAVLQGKPQPSAAAIASLQAAPIMEESKIPAIFRKAKPSQAAGAQAPKAPQAPKTAGAAVPPPAPAPSRKPWWRFW